MMRSRLSRAKGFTLVEIFIVITLIAILATVTIVSYNGAQRRAVATTMKTELAQAAKMMDAKFAQADEYPTTLPSDIQPSPDIILSIKQSTDPYYEDLSPVQQGVLFHTLCSQLVSEGYGTGTNIVGGTEQYVTGCYIYNYNNIHINGWNSNNFNVPIAQNTLHDWYDSTIGFEAYRPNKKATVLAFADELASRYQAQGGGFALTSFWDPWASPGNGVLKQDLPPSSSNNGQTYCMQAEQANGGSVVWHVQPSGVPIEGPC